ncbi:MAG: hypothetical protein WBE79_00380 [Candidatus Cybelea sp.]|jgi:hypothetical protein
MDLLVRGIRGDDLAACVPLLPGLALYRERDLIAWQAMWSEVVDSGAGFGCVMVDAQVPARCLAFGAAGFVSDERAERMHALETAGVMVAMTREYGTGSSPFLGVEPVAAGNAGDGLNLVAISGFGEIDEAGEQKLMLALLDDFRGRVGGFRVKSLFNECYRESLRAVAPAMMLPVREYSLETVRAAQIPIEHAPFVISSRITDTSFEQRSFLLSLYYNYSPPRFGFTLAEQRALRLAIEGLTDEEVASILSTSLAIVKKRFRSVYQKVLDAPGAPVIPHAEKQSGPRGPELRRHLIAYLRDHPQELAPYEFRRAKSRDATG